MNWWRIYLAAMLLTVVNCLPWLGHSEDAKDAALNVLPSTGAYVKIADKDKRFVGSYSGLVGESQRLSILLSAPLDEETRTAAFMNEQGLAPGINLEVSFGHDDTGTVIEKYQDRINQLPPATCKDLCKLYRVPNCDGSCGTAIAWLGDHRDISDSYKQVLDYDTATKGVKTEREKFFNQHLEDFNTFCSLERIDPCKTFKVEEWAHSHDTEMKMLTDLEEFQTESSARKNERTFYSHSQEFGKLCSDYALQPCTPEIVGKWAESRPDRLKYWNQVKDYGLQKDDHKATEYEKRRSRLQKFCDNNEMKECEQFQIDRWLDGNGSKLEGMDDKVKALRDYGDAVARDVDLNSIPLHGLTAHSCGVELAGHYDRTKAYPLNIAKDAKEYDDYGVRLGGYYTYFNPSWLHFGNTSENGNAITMRAGLALENDVTLKDFERCEALTSTSGTITGKSCKASKQVIQDPEQRLEGYAKIYWTYRYARDWGDTSPGMEFGTGVEGLGQSPNLVGMGSVFLTPKSDPLAGRFGLGVKISDALADSADRSIKKGDTHFTVFSFIGVSPTKMALNTSY